MIHEVDLWQNVFFDTSEDPARLREGNERESQHDPTVGGFSLETSGPAGLVADEAAGATISARIFPSRYYCLSPVYRTSGAVDD